MSDFIVLQVIKEHGEINDMIINKNRIITLDYKGKVLNGTADSWWLKYETEDRGTRSCVVLGNTNQLLGLLNEPS